MYSENDINIYWYINTVMFLRYATRNMFADGCSFESSRVKFARVRAFREKFATFI